MKFGGRTREAIRRQREWNRATSLPRWSLPKIFRNGEDFSDMTQCIFDIVGWFSRRNPDLALRRGAALA
jgi:hypothetical protein